MMGMRWKRLEVEQVRIARNDQIGLRGQRAGEHAVIIGVGKHGWADVGGSDELCQPCVAFNQGLRGEVLLAQALREFQILKRPCKFANQSCTAEAACTPFGNEAEQLMRRTLPE